MIHGHNETTKMIEEALEEMLYASAQGIMYRKNNNWAVSQNGCLGFPSAIILFSIVDAIGKYFAGKNLKINIDGQIITIENKPPWYKRFYILNSVYYSQNFSDKIIHEIYSKYRSALVHSATVDYGNFMDIGNRNDKPFETRHINNQYCLFVNLLPFWILNKNAVINFIDDLHSQYVSKFKNFTDNYINF